MQMYMYVLPYTCSLGRPPGQMLEHSQSTYGFNQSEVEMETFAGATLTCILASAR